MSQSTRDPSILLLHDGELADVAALLRELGAATTERHGVPASQDAEQSWRLVLASARRALEIPTSLIRASAQRIAILDGESRTVCSLLRRASFEIVVRRPVHPAALRLLLLHALYRGPEKRRTPRVSVGAQVYVRAGLRRHPVLLAEISERGCRVLSSQRVSVGQSLVLQIPAALAGGRAFSLKGLVVRATPAQIGAPGIVTLEFDPSSSRLRAQLRSLVSAHSRGPSALARGDVTLGAPGVAAASLAPDLAPPSPPLPDLTQIACTPELIVCTPEAIARTPEAIACPPAPTACTPEPTTWQPEPGACAPETEPAALALPEAAPTPPRLAPPKRLVPLCDEAARVVLARGLTRAGMRADPSQRLARSAELSLALHVDMDGPPILVRALVEPNAPGESGEAELGPWLRFADLAPCDGERLDAMLAGLSIFAGGDGPEHALVICEILEPRDG